MHFIPYTDVIAINFFPANQSLLSKIMELKVMRKWDLIAGPSVTKFEWIWFSSWDLGAEIRT